MKRTPANLHSSGFTLLELLVVMTLLSVLMAGFMSAIRTMAQVETKIDQQFDRLDNLRVAHAFLRRTLGQVSAQKTASSSNVGKQVVSFAATAMEINWIGTLPAGATTGGRRHFKVSVEKQNERSTLVLRVLPVRLETEQLDWAAAETHSLIADVTRVTVQARGLEPLGQTLEWPQGWQDGWPIEAELPDQVRLTLVLAPRAEVVSWTFPIFPLLQTDKSINIVTVGGGS